MHKTLNAKSILIVGCGIAGPALAYWLKQYGFNVTVLETAASLRTGGYKVDIRGKAIEVIKKMGLLQKIRDARVGMLSATFLNSSGKILADMPAAFLGMHEDDDIELLRSELSKILYEATASHCEYIFNDTIQSIKENDTHLTVEFKNTTSRTFDLLIGADGVHSKVRHMIFGEEKEFSYNLGDYYLAIFSIENYLKLARQELFYVQVNNIVNLYGFNSNEKMKVIFFFKSPIANLHKFERTAQLATLSTIFKNSQWEVPRLLQEMAQAQDLYFDCVEQIRMPCWHKNKIALIGDAAYCPSTGSGQGTSAALIGAYILARELAVAQGDHVLAFKEYEKHMKTFIEANQALGESLIKNMIPKNKFALFIQSLMFKVGFLSNFFIKKLRKQTNYAANCIDL